MFQKMYTSIVVFICLFFLSCLFCLSVILLCSFLLLSSVFLSSISLYFSISFFIPFFPALLYFFLSFVRCVVRSCCLVALCALFRYRFMCRCLLFFLFCMSFSFSVFSLSLCVFWNNFLSTCQPIIHLPMTSCLFSHFGVSVVPSNCALGKFSL